METNPFRAARLSAHAAARPGAPPRGRPAAEGAAAHVRASVGTALRERVGRAEDGRSWPFRAILVAVLAWILWRHATDPAYWSLLHGVTLAFHEMGHAFFMWFGDRFLTVAGGTVFQLAVPVTVAVLFYRQRDHAGIAFGVFWLGSSLWEAGRYAADARAQALPLVSPFGALDVDSHDWTYMLMRLGSLRHDEAIGGALRTSGLLTMLAAVAFGAWVVWVMATRARSAGGHRPAASPAAPMPSLLPETATEDAAAD